MRLSIRLRLFLSFLLATGLVVLGMLALMRWSTERGFAELIEAREAARVSALVDSLAEEHERDAWRALRADRQAWIRLLLDARDRHRRGPREPRWVRWASRAPEWPPRLPGPGARAPRRLALRVMLLDAGGGIVHGREDLLPDARRVPIESGGQVVGYLAIVPGPALSELGELRVLERQRSTLAVVAVAMVALSGILALLLAGRLVRPVRAFQAASRELAAGNYAARVNVHGKDELGRLGRDLNALAEALERHERDRRQWVADISHELRTPLAVLRGEIEAMQDGVRTIDRAGVDALHAEVLRLGRLVDDLYDLSTTDLGALSYRRAPVDAVGPLREVFDEMAGEFQAAHIEARLVAAPQRPCMVLADADRLAQLYRNLLRNSLRYTDVGGRLEVVVSAGAGRVVLDFQDSAPGVPDEALARLFERLYRVDASRARATGGAGLGLAICANIVAAHGGTVQARHSPLGGLWVCVTLPESA
jgi:two-component system sensor histidine kinase BaeS